MWYVRPNCPHPPQLHLTAEKARVTGLLMSAVWWTWNMQSQQKESLNCKYGLHEPWTPCLQVLLSISRKYRFCICGHVLGRDTEALPSVETPQIKSYMSQYFQFLFGVWHTAMVCLTLAHPLYLCLFYQFTNLPILPFISLILHFLNLQNTPKHKKVIARKMKFVQVVLSTRTL